MSEFQHTYSGGETQCTHCCGWTRGANLVTECPTRLRAEVELLRENVATFSDDFQRVTSEVCAPDEVHCSCVPHLRAALAAANAEAATMRAWAERAAGDENANAEDARKERVAVVAWLEKAGWMPSMVEVFKRGEHRKEKE